MYIGSYTHFDSAYQICSYGILLWEMMACDVPFFTESPLHVAKLAAEEVSDNKPFKCSLFYRIEDQKYQAVFRIPLWLILLKNVGFLMLIPDLHSLKLLYC